MTVPVVALITSKHREKRRTKQIYASNGKISTFFEICHTYMQMSIAQNIEKDERIKHS